MRHDGRCDFCGSYPRRDLLGVYCSMTCRTSADVSNPGWRRQICVCGCGLCLGELDLQRLPNNHKSTERSNLTIQPPPRGGGATKEDDDGDN